MITIINTTSLLTIPLHGDSPLVIQTTNERNSLHSAHFGDHKAIGFSRNILRYASPSHYEMMDATPIPQRVVLPTEYSYAWTDGSERT